MFIRTHRWVLGAMVCSHGVSFIHKVKKIYLSVSVCSNGPFWGGYFVVCGTKKVLTNVQEVKKII